MKRVMVISGIVAFAIFISACSVEVPEVVRVGSMEAVVEEESMSVVDAGIEDSGLYYDEFWYKDGVIEAMVSNGTDEIVMFDGNIVIEQKQEEEWVDLQYFKDGEMPEYTLRIEPQTRDSAGFLVGAYDLEAGEYRISREFWTVKNNAWMGIVYFTKLGDDEYENIKVWLDRLEK